MVIRPEFRMGQYRDDYREAAPYFIHNLYPFRVFEITNTHIKLTKETKLCYPFSFIAPQQFEDLDEIVINNTQLGFPSF